MSDLLDTTPDAKAWISEAISRYSMAGFGEIKSAVVWADSRDEDGNLLVPLDPTALSESLNKKRYPLLLGHDPGKPLGQILESAPFKSKDGRIFVAGIIGYYIEDQTLKFSELKVETNFIAPSPKTLRELPSDAWIEIAGDPREFDAEWINAISKTSPVEIKHITTSLNSAELTNELLHIGLSYLAIVWNPYVTSVASEAGKDTYAALSTWMRELIRKLSNKRAPILDIQTNYYECQISFIFRGSDINENYTAHDKLPEAAAQAAQLANNLKERGIDGERLVYEYDKESERWFPSYAVLKDGRIVTETMKLIAIENLPIGLSLGIAKR